MKQVCWSEKISRATPVLGAVVVSAIAISVLPESANAAQFDRGPNDDNTSSLGRFSIKINPTFQSLFNGYLGYENGTLTSPNLFDPNTVIGRSAVHTDGSLADMGGTMVGSAGTIISDSSFSKVPSGFEGPPGTNEVHTEVRSLNLTDFSGAAVRVGSAFGLPVSPGEVESNNTGMDFPADSFFNVFAEVDIPAMGSFPGATVFNTDAMLLRGDMNLNAFPPKVVYVHTGSDPVPVYFQTNGPGGAWTAGDRLGSLSLTGHGINFTQAEIGVFENRLINSPWSPPPPIDGDGGNGNGNGGGPGVPEPASTAFGSAIVLGFGTFFKRKISKKGKPNKKD